MHKALSKPKNAQQTIFNKAREISNFEYWEGKIRTEEKLAIAILSDTAIATAANKEYTILAHIAAGNWQTAARQIRTEYIQAINKPVVKINDRAIVIAQHTNVYGVSVLAEAEGMLMPFKNIPFLPDSFFGK